MASNQTNYLGVEMTNVILTQERLKELLNYNPDTGIFTRIGGTGARKIGKQSGCVCKAGYIVLGVDYKVYFAHRLAWLYMNGINPSEQVDHINGIRTDNRICNLRLASNSENSQNQRKARKDNASGLAGACYVKSSKNYKSQIKINCKTIHLGFFPSAIDAHNAYIEAKRKHHPFSTI